MDISVQLVEALAQEAGLDQLCGWDDDNNPKDYYECWPEDLQRFAVLLIEHYKLKTVDLPA